MVPNPTLSKTILDNLWQSGFCTILIEALRRTTPGTKDRTWRIEITRLHIADGCQTCHYANTLRSIEGDTAHRLGGAAMMLFQRSGDITKVPGFQAAFRETMGCAIAVGTVDNDILAWISRLVSERAGKPYPYVEPNNDAQAN